MKSPLDDMTKEDRLKYHRKVLRSVSIEHGFEGVKQYKANYPEANIIRVTVDAIAYSPKPKGYNSYLIRLVNLWLVDEGERNRSNSEDVKALNAYLGTAFNPANHFSNPLSNSRLTAIKRAFTERGAPLDTSGDTSMSKVRQAAKAAAGHWNADQSFGGVGVISGDTLAINGQTFPIVLNGTRRCIRVSIEGKRRRLYLDELEWAFGLLAASDADVLSTTKERSIRELAYSDETASVPRNDEPEISELAYSPNAFGRRVAALRGPPEVPPPEWPDGVDPLSLPDE